MICFVVSAALIVVTYLNLWTFGAESLANVPQRADSDVVLSEDQLAGIQSTLNALGHFGGKIRFLTTRDLNGEKPIRDDDYKWNKAQYAMLPWILIRNSLTLAMTPYPDATFEFVIGDFSAPEPMPAPRRFGSNL